MCVCAGVESAPFPVNHQNQSINQSMVGGAFSVAFPFPCLVGISAYPEKMGHPNSAAPVLRMGAFPAKAHPSQWYIHIHLKYRAAPNHQSWVLGLGSFNSFNMTTRVGNVI